jgi:hypothetical protein
MEDASDPLPLPLFYHTKTAVRLMSPRKGLAAAGLAQHVGSDVTSAIDLPRPASKSQPTV